MMRFFNDVGFGMIFIMAGALVGLVAASLALLVFAIGYSLFEGSLAAGRVFVTTFLIAWVASTVWLIRKKRKVDYRWNSNNYLNCLRCDYDLRGNQSTQCPECGYEHELHSATSVEHQRCLTSTPSPTSNSPALA